MPPPWNAGYDDDMSTTKHERTLLSLPPWVIDSAIGIALFVLALQERGFMEEMLGDVFGRTPDTLNLMLIALMTLPLSLRRRYPQTVFFIVLFAFVADRALDYPSTNASFGLALVFHAIGSELAPRRSAIMGFGVAGFLMLFTAFGAATLESVSLEDVITTTLVLVVPLLLGREVYQRRQRTQELEDRALQAEHEREERTRQAVIDEQARIARELHDVVAHQMAVINLQAEGARRLISNGSDTRVAEALDTIRRTSHDALIEMRRMVGLLRGATEETSALKPQPGLGDLDRLVEQMREAGLQVKLERRGETADLPSGIGLSAYRIVQESLTNALKHGGEQVRADVLVTYHDDRVEIEVTDDGTGDGPGGGTGQGLVGMRERVSVLDGELTTGRLPGGGFRVHATLPRGN
jgi:signal transduction histidine kinase